MPRYLGIDHGSKRLGLAVGDTDMGLATPIKQLDSSGTPRGDAAQFRPLIEEYGVDAIVIGLPINMDGTEGDQAKLVRRYGEGLAKELGLEEPAKKSEDPQKGKTRKKDKRKRRTPKGEILIYDDEPIEDPDKKKK